MAKIVSFINLKGGVGKTTMTVNIAANLASAFKKRVLVIDLDPQTNATISLIDQEHWELRNAAKQTLFHMFNDLLEGTQHFNIRQAILKNVAEIENLDLLPSSIDLVSIQEDIANITNKPVHKTFLHSVDIIANQLASIKHKYDFILIDCPPNLGTITLNGINCSDYYVIPTTPDILSRNGIRIITNQIDKFIHHRRTCTIKLAGVLFTKVDSRAKLHEKIIHELCHEPHLSPFVFKHRMPQRISIAEAPIDCRPHLTSKTALAKADYNEIQGHFEEIANEFLTRIANLQEGE